MNDRIQRFQIPSFVAFISFSFTLFVPTGLWATLLPCLSDSVSHLIGALAGTAVFSLGIGYICTIPIHLLQFSCRRFRFVDFSKFVGAFGAKCENECKCSCCSHCSCCTLGCLFKNCIRCLKNFIPCLRSDQACKCQDLANNLLDEFHVRFHSHAPKRLIDFATRRNTAWYIAHVSAIASFMGAVSAAAFAWVVKSCFPALVSTCCYSALGLCASLAFFAILVPWALWCQGRKWNREFWGVCWKWIHWDTREHKFPQEAKEWLGKQ